MGLFGKRESSEEIYQRISNSECADLFANVFKVILNEGDEHYQWLMQNSRERMFKLQVFREGVSIKYIEVSRSRLKQTGTYDVDEEGWGFGASGYQDLPNSSYVYEFKRYLIQQILSNCPNVSIVDNEYIKLKETAKKELVTDQRAV